MRYNITLLLLLITWLFFYSTVQGQKRSLFYPVLFQSMEWRPIGAHQGGAANTIVGVKDNVMTYYAGFNGGGLWKTTNGGVSWESCADASLSMEFISAIAIDPSNSNIIYVGTGVQSGVNEVFAPDAMLYKSTDGGMTWGMIKSFASKNISTISINPLDVSDIVVAIQGSSLNFAKERGVFRTVDSGDTWVHTLKLGENIGTCDVERDAANPNIVYAGMWTFDEKPWRMIGGGEMSAIYKSVDGGNSWSDSRRGLPSEIGKTGFGTAFNDSPVVYALVESHESGLYRSNDRGDTWMLVNNAPALLANMWQYATVVVDPLDNNTLYILNEKLWKSVDGGETFEVIDAPHSAYTDLWVNPINTQNIALATKNGVSISMDGGKSWSSTINQPTGQILALAAKDENPYTLYYAQEGVGVFETSLLTGKTKTIELLPRRQNEEYTGLINSATVLYATTNQGNIVQYHKEDEYVQDVTTTPQEKLGLAPMHHTYRYSANNKMILSPFDETEVYHAANVVFYSDDMAEYWTKISPDLTRDEVGKQRKNNGYFKNKATGAQTYNTIAALAHSPIDSNIIWVGTDDGMIHITDDKGQNWKNVTPPDIGEAYIEDIVVSKYNKEEVFVVANKHRIGIEKSFVLHTKDNGATWAKAKKGLGRSTIVTSVLQDPIKQGMLYAGTNNGVFISMNNGLRWKKFQHNLPACPVVDMLITNNSLVVATNGRGVWMIDDLAPLQQGSQLVRTKKNSLFQKPEYDIDLAQRQGILIDYYLSESIAKSSFSLFVTDNKGQIVRSFAKEYLTNTKGLNRLTWDLRSDDLVTATSLFTDDLYQGTKIIPGDYHLNMIVKGDTLSTSLDFVSTQQELVNTHYIDQYKQLKSIDKLLVDIYTSTTSIVEVHTQLNNLLLYLERVPDSENLVQYGKEIVWKVESLEKQLLPLRIQYKHDVALYPSTLSEELYGLKKRIELYPKVTRSTRKQLARLVSDWEEAKGKIDNVITHDIANFNDLYRQQGIPALIVDADKTK